MEKSIFNSLDIFPVIFLTKESSFNYQLPKVRVRTQRKPIVRKKVNPFYLNPQKENSVSKVSLLKKHYGVLSRRKKSFKTPFICSSLTTGYNGSLFHLLLDGENVFLNVISKGRVSKECHWTIVDISNTMKKKNPGYEVITPKFIKELISKNMLQVKFNVSEIKDHGTIWKVIIEDED